MNKRSWRENKEFIMKILNINRDSCLQTWDLNMMLVLMQAQMEKITKVLSSLVLIHSQNVKRQFEHFHSRHFIRLISLLIQFSLLNSWSKTGSKVVPTISITTQQISSLNKNSKQFGGNNRIENCKKREQKRKLNS